MPVERVKRRAVLVTALAVGAVTATTGIIGFIGLVAPHCVRLVAGPDHRIVLPGSALLGAALVLAADSVARTVVQAGRVAAGRADGFCRRAVFPVAAAPFPRAHMRAADERTQPD